MSNEHLNKDKEELSLMDREFENHIRPAVISDFSGQQKIIDNLKIFIQAAKMRDEPLDHIFVSWPARFGENNAFKDSGQ